MYEECAEAHAHWLKAQEHKKDYDHRGAPDPSGEQFYLNCAFTSWKAHKLGVCSDELERKYPMKRS